MKRFASGWAWMALAFGLWACASTREAGVLPADEQFQAAARLYEDGQYDRAVSAFQAFVFNYPQDPRVPEARWLAADSYYPTANLQKAKDYGIAIVDEPSFLATIGIPSDLIGHGSTRWASGIAARR